MPTFFMMVGLPASGKSTKAKYMRDVYKGSVLVSTDSIRREVFKDEKDQTHNVEVFKIAQQRIREALLEDRDVIFDATNLKRKQRMGILKSLPKCRREALVMATPYETCLERNRDRGRVVPEEVIKKMYFGYQPPHYAEGFDCIDYIQSEGIDLDSLMIKNIACQHDNPNHKLSCGEHCIEAFCSMFKIIMKKKFEDKIDDFYSYYGITEESLLMASLCHDLSKFKCKTFYTYQGEKSDKAHYYSHESVSAYDFMCWERTMFMNAHELTYILNLIYSHMIFYNKDTAAIEKRKKFYGDCFWEVLEMLHQADKEAH